jgi:hypothetical protein
MVHDAGFAEVDLEVLDFEERHGFGSLVRASPMDLGDIQFLISRNRPSLDRVRETIDHFPEPAKGRAQDFCAPKDCSERLLRSTPKITGLFHTLANDSAVLTAHSTLFLG